jgi:cyclopropane-fatty-acyl-phospholipid synthase
MVPTSQRLVRAFTRLMERGLLPDSLIRWGIRRLIRQRARTLGAPSPSGQLEANRRFLDVMRSSPVALVPDRANEQHYEVPAAFFERVLGPRRKYSCCCYPEGVASLGEAEERALALTCERAGIQDGMKVLELGCGWGSLTLWMAQHYPDSNITAVSNSHSQREFIEHVCTERGTENVHVITSDMNEFTPPDTGFDRVVSVEMFEHMRNWPELLRRIASWLLPDGRLFVHVFCHRTSVYEYETKDETDWMAREFFTGGVMPSDDLILHCQDDLVLEERWRIDGLHYHKTCEAWLSNLDRQRAEVLPLFSASYGAQEAERWLQRWRVFFMACSELFAHNRGREWWVGHYLLRQRTSRQ